MAKAIFRLEKIKTNDAIRKCSAHNFRFQKVENADENKLKLNRVLKKPESSNLLQTFNNKIESEKITVRNSQTVKMLDLFFSASPEFFQDMTRKKSTRYLNDCLQWAENHFGKDNVICAIAHFDEKTPHMHLQVVPNDNGKLNAKRWTAGRKMMSDMQTDFANHVIKKGWDLERGTIGSTANHKTVKEFYNMINNSVDNKPTLLSKVKSFTKIGSILETNNALKNYNNFMLSQYSEKNTQLKKQVEKRDDEIKKLSNDLESEKNKSIIKDRKYSDLLSQVEKETNKKNDFMQKYFQFRNELKRIDKNNRLFNKSSNYSNDIK